MTLQMTMFAPSFSGVRIIESEHATALPTAKPLTDDMHAMVEHLRDLGQIRRLPAAYQAGDDLVVVHPSIAAKLRRSLARLSDEIAERAFSSHVL
jgi:hypothetical protein